MSLVLGMNNFSYISCQSYFSAIWLLSPQENVESHFVTLFKRRLRLWKIYDLCISIWKNLIFSKGYHEKIEFLIFLHSSIMLEAMKKKLATSSFPRYFYANLPDMKKLHCILLKFISFAFWHLEYYNHVYSTGHY